MDAAVLPIAPEPLSQTQLAAADKVGPSDHEIARFTEIMNNPQHRTNDSTQVEVVHQSYMASEASKPLVSLGDTILSRLQELGQGYQSRIQQLEQRMNKPVHSPAEANKLFFEVSQISIQQQMALAVTSKVNKNAESLLKAQ